MKNINTVINVVLGIAVAVLFYFQFSGAKPAVVAGSKSVVIIKKPKNGTQNNSN